VSASTATLPRGRFAVVQPWVSTVARLLVAGVLIAAGALKVVEPASSVAAVRSYQLLPEALVTPVGWGLPFLELALGLLLVVGLFTRQVAIASGVLFVLFILAVASAAARGLSIDCGCFGGGGEVAPGETQYAAEIIRDLGLVVVCAWLAWQPTSRLALDGSFREVRQ
jgi:uncharacterized membrane protein YphA (DoxX/SURF4 family)